VEQQEAREGEHIAACEARAREWLLYLVACLDPASATKSFLKNCSDVPNHDRCGSPTVLTRFVYVLPSGHEVSLEPTH